MTQIRKRSHSTTAVVSVLILVVLAVTWGYCALAVSIDIRPGGFPNTVNLRSRGMLPVAILTTPDFDAMQVDPDSVLLGDAGLSGTAVVFKSTIEDVNGNGFLDLLLFFKIAELVDNRALDASSTVLTLTGDTFDGISVEGSDSVRLVPPG